MGHAHNNHVQGLWLYGDCLTVEGAIAKALNNREERDGAVSTNQATQMAGKMRLEGAKTRIAHLERRIAQIEAELAGTDTVVHVEGQEPPKPPKPLSAKKRLELEMKVEELRIEQYEAAAKLLEAQAHADTTERAFQKAIQEREDLTNLINDLLENSSMRQLWEDDPERAAERAAMLESTFEFMVRIEDSLATSGTIASDQLRAAKVLPTWQTLIRPWLQACRDALAEGGLLPDELLVSKHLSQRLFPIAHEDLHAVADLVREEGAFWQLPGVPQQKAFNDRPALVHATKDHVPGLRRPEVYQALPLNATPAEVAAVRDRRMATVTHEAKALAAGAQGQLEGPEGELKLAEADLGANVPFQAREARTVDPIFGAAHYSVVPAVDDDEQEDEVIPVPAWHKGTEAEYRVMEAAFLEGTARSERAAAALELEQQEHGPVPDFSPSPLGASWAPKS